MEDAPPQSGPPAIQAGPADRSPAAWGRRLLPFLTAAALVAFVLSRLDFAALVQAFSRVNYALLALFAVTFVFGLLMADAVATRQVYKRTIHDVSLKDLLVLRAASYLPSIVNHHLGQAWLTYFLSRVYGAPLWRVAGATLLVYTTILGGLILLTTASLPFETAASPWLLPTLAGLLGAGAVYLVIVHLRPAFLRRRAPLAPLLEVGVRGHLVLLAYRVPHLVVLFVGNWVPFALFGVDIPLGDALAVIPVIMLASALPITPQGLGTRDALALELLSGYAVGSKPERAAALAAATLSFAVSTTLVQLLMSPLFMSRAYRLLGLRRDTAG